jgi:hypothetical protein
MAGFTFFEGVVNEPWEEIAFMLERVDSDNLDSIISLQGRLFCLGRVVTHASSIGNDTELDIFNPFVATRAERQVGVEPNFNFHPPH